MSEKTSITVSSINGNTKTTKSITDINPNATDAELIALTNALYGMTTNSVSSASKVTKRDVIADGLYPLVLSTSVGQGVAGTTFVKVDDTHYTLDLTAFAAQEQHAIIRINATVNGQAMRPSTITYTAPIAATGEGYAFDFMSGTDSGSPEIDIAFLNNDVNINTALAGTYLITFNAGTFGDYNYGAATITVTATKGA